MNKIIKNKTCVYCNQKFLEKVTFFTCCNVEHGIRLSIKNKDFVLNIVENSPRLLLQYTAIITVYPVFSAKEIVSDTEEFVGDLLEETGKLAFYYEYGDLIKDVPCPTFPSAKFLHDNFAKFKKMLNFA